MEVDQKNERQLPVHRLSCIVKLGGAAVTVKDQLETLNDHVLDATAAHLSEAMRHLSDHDGANNGSSPIIIVHGAGSFGHFQAKATGVHTGGIESPSVRDGFVSTRLSVTKLNHIVVSRLASAGVPAVGLSPCGSGWSTCGKQLATCNTTEVCRGLAAGLTPVMHGDAVLDSQQGCAILSGDVIVRQLARDLRPKFVVFLTNVAGVYDRPPHMEGAKLLQEIAVSPDGAWRVVTPKDPSLHMGGVMVDSAGHDTTGGMATKIAEAAEIATHGVPVLIAQAGTPDALRAVSGLVDLVHAEGRRGWNGTLIRTDGGHRKDLVESTLQIRVGEERT